MTHPIRLLIVDDHAVFRDSLREKLDREPDVEVVDTAGDADAGLSKALEQNPDIIVMDIDMPGLVVFDAARQIMSRRPATRLIFLSAYSHDAYIEQALQVKARGYVTKKEPYENLLQAIRDVAAGTVFYSEEVRSRIVVGSKGAGLSDASRSRGSSLTARELEVLRYIARGMTKKEIAQTMHLSHRTVDNHTTRLMTKLDLHSRVELTRYAIREGLSEA